MNWFERLTGFREAGYQATREQLEVSGDTLRSKVNGRSYGIGTLEVIDLAELRSRGRGQPTSPGRLKVSTVSGDVRHMHRAPELRGALFQVASQFNLLEMVSPEITPEHGVTIYERDPTQGPACAIAAGAATIYRNYFAPVGAQEGQTTTRQIDCLAEVGSALGNTDARLWRMKNGYALCSESGLKEIRAQLHALSEDGLDDLRSKLKIGVHWNVEATEAVGYENFRISQAFCSALPVAYGDPPAKEWAEFAQLILEGAYEATLWTARLNASRSGSNIVLLTRLGGGAFGNEHQWIQGAIRRALNVFRASDLDVRLVCRGAPDRQQLALVDEFR